MCFHTRTQTLRIHGGGRAGEEAQGFQAAGNPGCPEHAVFQRRRPARSRGLGGCWPAALSGHKSGEEVVRRGVCWLHAHYARVLVLLQNEQRKASRAAEDDQRRDPEQGRLRGHQCRPHKKTWSRNAIGALVTSRSETPPLPLRTPSYRDVL